jgi:hypothetical protein
MLRFLHGPATSGQRIAVKQLSAGKNSIRIRPRYIATSLTTRARESYVLGISKVIGALPRASPPQITNPKAWHLPSPGSFRPRRLGWVGSILPTILHHGISTWRLKRRLSWHHQDDPPNTVSHSSFSQFRPAAVATWAAFCRVSEILNPRAAPADRSRRQRGAIF